MRINSYLTWSSVFLVSVFAVAVSAPRSSAEQILFFDFNDASDPDIAVDSSGKGNDGLVQLAEYTGPGGGVSGAVDDLAMDLGDFGNGAYIDLTDLAIDGAFDSMTDNDEATIAFWLFGNDQQPQSQWTFWFGPDRQLGSHAPWGDGTVYFDVAGCCGANQRISQNVPDASQYSGQWNHFAFVKDQTYTAVYLNGDVLVDSGANEKDPLNIITEAAFGADAAGGASHGGLMDDIGVWDEALEEDAIKQLMGDAPPIYVGGRNTIGANTYAGERSNVVLGPEETGVPGFSGRIVTADVHELTIASQTTAELVLEDFEGEKAIGAYSTVDLAGGNGTFPDNHAYPNGVNDASQNDFAVEVKANITIPAGEWTLGFGSDDGGQVTIAGVEFDFDTSLNNDSVDDDQIRFEAPRGHGWTAASFELEAELETEIVGSFYERGGGDSFEIAVLDETRVEAANPANGWELLADGTFDWSVTTTAEPLLSADLTATVTASREMEFDVNGDTGESDMLTMDNPDPDVFTTIMDITNGDKDLTFQIKSTGDVSSGEAFTIVDADQIVGTPTITSVNAGQSWVWDGDHGRVCLDTCPPIGNDPCDFDGSGSLDIADVEILTAAIAAGDMDAKFDVNGDGIVSAADQKFFVEDASKMNSYLGDGNLDGEFNTNDLVGFFQAGKFETGSAATFAQGDHNADGMFNTSDLVSMFQSGGFEKGPKAAVAAVPEPSSLVLALLSFIGLVGLTRRTNN